MDGAQVRVLEDAHEVGLGTLLSKNKAYKNIFFSKIATKA
jgi:hypothetical protein